MIADIKPGFVKTAMAQGDVIPWAAPGKSSQADLQCHPTQKTCAYVARRW